MTDVAITHTTAETRFVEAAGVDFEVAGEVNEFLA